MKTLLATIALAATTTTAFADNLVVLKCSTDDSAHVFEVTHSNITGVTTVDGREMGVTKITDRSVFTYTIEDLGTIINSTESMDIDRFTGRFVLIDQYTNVQQPALDYDVMVQGSCNSLERQF